MAPVDIDRDFLYPLLSLISAASLLYLAYLWALPKPIPGIPYDKSAKNSLLGNFSDIQAYVRETKRFRPWLTTHIRRHNSPLTQVWLGPFTKPALVLTDFQESYDILIRRHKEFDKALSNLAAFSSIVKDAQISMFGSDHRYKGNKELARDVMTPGFLHEVSAPEIYKKTQTLIALWTLKTQLANGRPFFAKNDLSDMVMDIVSAAAFGLDESMSTTNDQLVALNAHSEEFSANADGPVDFPRVPHKPEMTALLDLTDHVGAQFKNPFPELVHYFRLLTHPTLSASYALKDRWIHDEIEKALPRLQRGESETRSAMDQFLQREIQIAAKENRKPNFHSGRIYDELVQYFIAGHDTTTTAISWLVKNIADHPDSQEKLRAALRTAYATAYEEGRQPTVEEICRTTIPYHDAVIEECLRYNSPVAVVARQTTVNTTLLGYEIPKGTMLIIIWDGPDFTEPPMPLADGVRSETSKRVRERWNPDDIRLFKPERWLKVDEKGNEYFDSQAGPMLAFALGPRACFGRRLAYLKMRIILTLLVWNFKFHKLPEELSSREAHEEITTPPVQCYVSLSKADPRL
ncbi:hypothetical protein M426DRAFT_60775 [Hypoxylon sp. CI-4A]|nr:hypothetical protein M426DRAFT_60775 [Hypoxylon sp. CI-4A]